MAFMSGFRRRFESFPVRLAGQPYFYPEGRGYKRCSIHIFREDFVRCACGRQISENESREVAVTAGAAERGEKCLPFEFSLYLLFSLVRSSRQS